MKKLITILGSLFVFAGLKAQTITTVKKETVKPVTDTTIVSNTVQKQLKITNIRQTSPAIKKTSKITEPVIKISTKAAIKPMKD